MICEVGIVLNGDSKLSLFYSYISPAGDITPVPLSLHLVGSSVQVERFSAQEAERPVVERELFPSFC